MVSPPPSPTPHPSKLQGTPPPRADHTTTHPPSTQATCLPFSPFTLTCPPSSSPPTHTKKDRGNTEARNKQAPPQPPLLAPHHTMPCLFHLACLAALLGTVQGQDQGTSITSPYLRYVSLVPFSCRFLHVEETQPTH